MELRYQLIEEDYNRAWAMLKRTKSPDWRTFFSSPHDMQMYHKDSANPNILKQQEYVLNETEYPIGDIRLVLEGDKLTEYSYWQRFIMKKEYTRACAYANLSGICTSEDYTGFLVESHHILVDNNYAFTDGDAYYGFFTFLASKFKEPIPFHIFRAKDRFSPSKPYKKTYLAAGEAVDEVLLGWEPRKY